MDNKKQQLIIVCFITTLFIVVCTSNLIFKDEDPSSQRIVEGKVRLSDIASQGAIFVWLESLKISTYTDEEGAFSLQLPPLQCQPVGGLSGEYNIYYYVGNYALASSSLVLQDGSILYEAGDVDSEGNIDETIVLRKLLDIKTEINLSAIKETDSLRLVITVILDPQGDPVDVETMKSPDDWLTRMIFKEIDESIDEADLYAAGG